MSKLTKGSCSGDKLECKGSRPMRIHAVRSRSKPKHMNHPRKRRTSHIAYQLGFCTPHRHRHHQTAINAKLYKLHAAPQSCCPKTKTHPLCTSAIEQSAG